MCAGKEGEVRGERCVVWGEQSGREGRGVDRYRVEEVRRACGGV